MDEENIRSSYDGRSRAAYPGKWWYQPSEREGFVGSLLQRVIYHYWYHTGENLAIRQMLGQVNLPEFVGDIDGEAPYRAG